MSSGRSGQPDYSGTVLGPRMVPATYERRTIILNDSEITTGAPPSNRSADDYGKFFPRGMRGTIEEIRLYAQGDGADTVVVNISPQPGLGSTYTATITPPAAWGWVDAAFNVMWNYDSLYVWLSDIEANVDWGYDEVLPYDGHFTDDGGATFTDLDERPFIRVVMAGETAGDVPISGIVNNIPIPSVGSLTTEEALAVSKSVDTNVVTIDGAGYVDLFTFTAITHADTHLTFLSVICDGVTAFDFCFYDLMDMGVNPNTPGISLTEYDRDGMCTMMVHKRFEFKRQLRLQALNNFSVQSVTAKVYANLMR